MVLRIKRQFVFLLLFILAGFFLYRQSPYLLLHNQEDSLDLSSNNLNVTEESYDGACQCSSCESQQNEPEVMDWDSSKVLRGSPTELFRGMLSH